MLLVFVGRLICVAVMVFHGGQRAYSADATAAAVMVQTIADLEALPTPAAGGPVWAEVAGYLRAADGGGGAFAWLPDSAMPADDVFVFASRSRSDGRWFRVADGAHIVPEMAGAVGDGTTDDSATFERLVELSGKRGAFTITLSPGRHYYFANTLGFEHRVRPA